MKSKFVICISMLGGCILLLGTWWTAMALEGERVARATVPEGVYIDLTRDFYEALKRDGGDSKVYSNDPSDQYLRQIAVSAKFMVETNLQILKQQEEIRLLLRELLSNKK